jgi:hypothetical protein
VYNTRTIIFIDRVSVCEQYYAHVEYHRKFITIIVVIIRFVFLSLGFQVQIIITIFSILILIFLAVQIGRRAQ